MLPKGAPKMSALWAIRILRKFRHTGRFDRHLDDCAVLAVLVPLFEAGVPHLRLAHVLRLISLPCLDPSLLDPVDGRIDIPVLPENVIWLRREQRPEIFNRVSVTYNGPQPSA
jgi:hypothetical protein